MDIDKGTIAAALAGGAETVQSVRRYQIGKRFLKGEVNQRLWAIIEDHVDQYGTVPTKELIEKHVIEYVPFDGDLEPMDFYMAELRYRDRQEAWFKLGPELGKEVGAGELMKAKQRVRNFLVRDDFVENETKQYVKPIFSMIDAAKERYERVASGKIGVPYPWAKMNEVTLGGEAGDFNGFLGRLGQGKTMVALVASHHAWVKDYKVLFVSPEMSAMQLTQRFFSYHLKLPQGLVRRGRLDLFMKEKYFTELENMRDLTNFYIISDEFRISIDLIEAAIDQIKPDKVVIDGAYLVVAEPGLNRQENAERVADMLPQLAKRKGVTMDFTTQLNRTAQKNDPDTFLDTAIGLTDAFGQNATNLWAVIQTEDMKADNELSLKSLKAREDRGDTTIRINWDWERNNFSEIGGSASEYQDRDYELYKKEAEEKNTDTVTLPADNASKEYDDIPFAMNVAGHVEELWWRRRRTFERF